MAACANDTRLLGAHSGRPWTQDTFRWACVLGILALVVVCCIGDLLERRHIFRIPEAAVGLGLGGLCAAVAMISSTELLDDEQFNDEFFMVWLLPPIIFAAGFNMNIPAFFANILPTMLLAFVGTSLSAAIVAAMVYQAGQMGLCYPLSKLASLFFGSLISATDPVTVLAVFKAIGAIAGGKRPPTLSKDGGPHLPLWTV